MTILTIGCLDSNSLTKTTSTVTWVKYESLYPVYWDYIAVRLEAAIFHVNIDLNKREKHALVCPLCGKSFSIEVFPKELTKEEIKRQQTIFKVDAFLALFFGGLMIVFGILVDNAWLIPFPILFLVGILALYKARHPTIIRKWGGGCVIQGPKTVITTVSKTFKEDLHLIMQMVEEGLGRYLFSIDVGFEDELNKGIIPREVINEIGKIPLTPDPNELIITKKDGEWLLTGEKNYSIKKGDGKLNIYEDFVSNWYPAPPPSGIRP